MTASPTAPALPHTNAKPGSASTCFEFGPSTRRVSSIPPPLPSAGGFSPGGPSDPRSRARAQILASDEQGIERASPEPPGCCSGEALSMPLGLSPVDSGSGRAAASACVCARGPSPRRERLPSPSECRDRSKDSRAVRRSAAAAGRGAGQLRSGTADEITAVVVPGRQSPRLHRQCRGDRRYLRRPRRRLAPATVAELPSCSVPGRSGLHAGRPHARGDRDPGRSRSVQPTGPARSFRAATRRPVRDLGDHGRRLAPAPADAVAAAGAARAGCVLRRRQDSGGRRL